MRGPLIILKSHEALMLWSNWIPAVPKRTAVQFLIQWLKFFEHICLHSELMTEGGKLQENPDLIYVRKMIYKHTYK